MTRSTLLGLALGILFWAALVGTLLSRRNGYRPDFHDPDPAVRADAIRRTPYDAVSQIPVELLQDENPDVRLLAAMRCPAWGLVGAKSLRDDNAAVRLQAARRVGTIGPGAWPEIQIALKDKNPSVRAAGLMALQPDPEAESRSGWNMEEVTSILLPMADNDVDPEVRQLAKQIVESIVKQAARRRR